MLLPVVRPWAQLPPPGARIAQAYLDRAVLVVDGGDVRHNRAYGSAPDGYQLVGTRSVGSGGPGYAASSSTTVSARTTASNPDELFKLSSGSDWTMQFVVENIGVASGANAGWFRSGISNLGSTFVVTNGTTRRPWLRVNGVDVLKPTSGAQWVDGTTVNLIVRFRSGVATDIWFNGQKQFSATHSTATPAISGNLDGIWALFTNGGSENIRGNLVAFRVWSRYLPDKETSDLAVNAVALYDLRRQLLPLPSGSVLSAGIGEALSLSEAISQAVQSFSAQTESVALSHSQTYPAYSLLTLPRPVRRLSAPARRLTTWFHADRTEHLGWTLAGTQANIFRRGVGAERYMELSVSNAAYRAMQDSLYTLNFTILLRMRWEFGNNAPVLAIGNNANSNQHFLTISSTGALTMNTAGWNGSTTTTTNSAATPNLSADRLYNVAVRVRPFLTEIWVDGVKQVSTANSMSSISYTMHNVILNGSWSGSTPATSTNNIGIAALAILPDQVFDDPELRAITADPLGIHKLFEDRRQPFLLPQILGNSYADGVQDAVVLSETSSRASTVPGAQTESVASSDAVAGLQAAIAASSESLSLADSITRLAAYAVNLPEAIAAADGAAVIATILAANAEALVATDTQAAVMVGLAAIGEPLSLAATSNGTTAGLWSDSVGESVALVDTRVANALLLAARSEALSVSDAEAAQGLLPAAVGESITPQDAVAKVAILVAQSLESLALVDAPSLQATLVASLADALALAAATNGVVLTLTLGGAEGAVYVVMQLLSVSVEAQDLRVMVPMDEDVAV